MWNDFNIFSGFNFVFEFRDADQFVFDADNDNLLSQVAQIQSFFDCTISAADYIDSFAFIVFAIAWSVQTHTTKVFTWDSQHFWRSAISKNHCFGFVFTFIGFDFFWFADQINVFNFFYTNFNARVLSLLFQSCRKGLSSFTRNDSGIVSNSRDVANQAAYTFLVKNQNIFERMKSFFR